MKTSLMPRREQTDEAVVERARRAVSAGRNLRWLMLVYAFLFLGLAGYVTLKSFARLDSLGEEQLSEGFVFGVALAVVWPSFGLLGGLCLTKFLTGFGRDFRTQELLVHYHDRLRELNDLSDPQSARPSSSRRIPP